MLEEINNLFRKIFSNEESLVFALLLGLAFFALYFLGNILTPFLISIIFAYLLVGMQSRLEKYGLGKSLSLILTYTFFLLIGIALMIWLIPLVSQQLQSLIVEIPKWLNAFMFFVQDIPTKYPDLVSSDQIATFLQTASSQITSISQDFLKASISGIQNTLLVAIKSPYLAKFSLLISTGLKIFSIIQFFQKL